MGRYSEALKLIGDVLRETKEELLTTVFVIHTPTAKPHFSAGRNWRKLLICVLRVCFRGLERLCQISSPMRGEVSRPDRLDDRVGDPCEASSVFRREKLTSTLMFFAEHEAQPFCLYPLRACRVLIS